ncbi:MAG: hypothetical protein JNJ59_04095 [Deltaproteobacteria bacterium]|nr:hypothetical protein [Deltaproteobacteria bacterium]
MKLSPLLIASSLVVLPACDDGAAKPEARGYQLRVAPLDLPGIVDTCYRATVYNTTDAGLFAGGNNTVWTQPYLCAGQYGDGLGSLTYVGTCDASGGTPTSPALNTVELELRAIVVADADANDGEVDDPATPYDETATDTLAAPKDYFNPCQAPNFCRLQKPCIENADTLVEFNLTVMRAAKQGFFDIAVNFEDVFCSAKFDCQYPDGNDADTIDDAITLVFDEAGKRRDTGVLGFACTAGAATTLEGRRTYLYMDDFTVTCTDALGAEVWSETFDSATAVPGNQLSPPRPLTNTNTNTTSLHCDCGGGPIDECLDVVCESGTAGDLCNTLCSQRNLGGVGSAICQNNDAACGIASPVFQYGIYQGEEFVGADFTMVYWNLAIGFNVAAMQGLQCTLTTRATASGDDGFGHQGLPSNTTVAGTTYPYLTWNINLNDPGRPGTGLTCGQNPVGAAAVGVLFFSDSGVRPHYTTLPAGTESFDNCGTIEGGDFKTHAGPCDPGGQDL